MKQSEYLEGTMGDGEKTIEHAVEIAVVRGNRYIKGDVSIQDLPSKVAEFGMYMLAKSKQLGELRSESLRDELTDMQGKVDDMRRTLFTIKAQTFKPNP